MSLVMKQLVLAVGLVALVAAGTLGRLGRLLPGQSTALIALLGFVSVALVLLIRPRPELSHR